MKGNSLATVTPDNGGWLMRGVKVCKPGTRISNWTFLSIGPKKSLPIQPEVVEFAKFLNNNMGIPMDTQPSPATGYHVSEDPSEEELRAEFEKLASQKRRPQFVLVVLWDKNTTYNTIKRLADVDFGVHTVCVRQDLLVKKQGQAGLFANLGLKVNLKFGGVNQRVVDDTQLVKNTMFVGYDVTHPTNLPSGTGQNAPSLVGLVASVDSDLARWPAVTWENESRQEMVGTEFVEHFGARLKLWQKENKRLPKNIVIFRDGVSEGQFRLVLDKELPHIRTACQDVYSVAKVTKPRISLIVSVKRHQTRFYPTDANHMHPGSKSPKEGTIVDRGVTNVRYWDFFLQAHASLQGRPFLRAHPFVTSLTNIIPSQGRLAPPTTLFFSMRFSELTMDPKLPTCSRG